MALGWAQRVLLALVAAFALPVCARAAPAGLTAAGQGAFDRHDLTTARGLWRQAAQAGDGVAAFDLGLLDDLGQGTPPDPVTAYAWYRRAAATGLAEAEFNLAVMLDSGRGVHHDAAAAALWYGRAAAHGDARAEYNLALLYAAGDGVPRNPDQARVWYRAAAAHGITAADPAPPGPRPTNAALVPVTPLVAVQLFDRNGHRATELVWLAPPQPAPTRYVAALYARTPAGLHPLLSQTTSHSALLVDLPPGRGDYVWRVYTTADAAPHYVASRWTALSAH